MERRAFLRGAAPAAVGLFAGCAGWGGGDVGDLTPADDATTTASGEDPRFKSIIQTVNGADNGTLVAEIQVYNIAQQKQTGSVSVVAVVNGTRHVATREVTLEGGENERVSFTFPNVSREAFGDGGSIRNITVGPAN